MPDRTCENCCHWKMRRTYDGTGVCLAPWTYERNEPRPEQVLTLMEDRCQSFEGREVERG